MDEIFSITVWKRSCDSKDDVCGACEGEVTRKELFLLSVGTFIYAAALAYRGPERWGIPLYLISYGIIGGAVIAKASANLFHGRIFDENFLLTVATLGAIAIREFPEAVAVMLFFRAGEILQDLAINRSRKSIRSLIELRAEYANLLTDEGVKKVDPSEIAIGEIIIIKPGERVPLDGVVVEGESLLDTSALTGESVPRHVSPGHEILSGMINKSGLLKIRTTKRLEESTVSKILDLVESAASRKSHTERFITRFARYYTPAVVGVAGFIAVVPVLLYRIPGLEFMFTHEETFSEWIYRALIFLVISCPCALVISIPLGFFSGIGTASRKGILVKGSNYLEALGDLDTVVWDKTGTLTEGIFKVSEVVSAGEASKEEILKMAAMAESHSGHPIAQSILEAYGEISDLHVKSYKEIPGHGVIAVAEGHEIIVGNDRLLHRMGIVHQTCDVKGTVVHVCVDRRYMGYIKISDRIRDDAKKAIEKLRHYGIRRQIMLTGDGEDVAREVAETLGLDAYYAELLPQDKVRVLEELMDENGLTAFVGDGINDAPALIRSDVGIAMGALGTDAAIEAADVVLMTDEPSRLPEAVRISRRTKRVVWENIALALGIKGFIMGMGILGMATLWEAIFADVGVSLIAIVNAMRLPFMEKRD